MSDIFIMPVEDASHVVMLNYKGIYFVYIADEKTHEIYTHLRRSAYAFQLFSTLSTLAQLIYATEKSVQAHEIYEKLIIKLKTIKKT